MVIRITPSYLSLCKRSDWWQLISVRDLLDADAAALIAADNSASLESEMTACIGELVSSTDHTLLHDCSVKTSVMLIAVFHSNYC